MKFYLTIISICLSVITLVAIDFYLGAFEQPQNTHYRSRRDHVDQAVALYHKGQYHELIQLAEEQTQARPGDVYFRIMRARAWYLLDDKQRALDEVIRLSYTYPQFYDECEELRKGMELGIQVDNKGR